MEKRKEKKTNDVYLHMLCTNKSFGEKIGIQDYTKGRINLHLTLF